MWGLPVANVWPRVRFDRLKHCGLAGAETRPGSRHFDAPGQARGKGDENLEFWRVWPVAGRG